MTDSTCLHCSECRCGRAAHDSDRIAGLVTERDDLRKALDACESLNDDLSDRLASAEGALRLKAREAQHAFETALGAAKQRDAARAAQRPDMTQVVGALRSELCDAESRLASAEQRAAAYGRELDAERRAVERLASGQKQEREAANEATLVANAATAQMVELRMALGHALESAADGFGHRWQDQQPGKCRSCDRLKAAAALLERARGGK